VQENRQRLDRWLWHARVVKTRASAAALAASGHVRLNGKRIAAPGRAVSPGDVLTIALSRSIKVLRIVDVAARRGGAGEARSLYEDLGPVLAGDEGVR
jgi:ribosome-associated heat shock protein Hsp15